MVANSNLNGEKTGKMSKQKFESEKAINGVLKKTLRCQNTPKSRKHDY